MRVLPLKSHIIHTDVLYEYSTVPYATHMSPSRRIRWSWFPCWWSGTHLPRVFSLFLCLHAFFHAFNNRLSLSPFAILLAQTLFCYCTLGPVSAYRSSPFPGRTDLAYSSLSIFLSFGTLQATHCSDSSGGCHSATRVFGSAFLNSNLPIQNSGSRSPFGADFPLMLKNHQECVI